MRKKEVDEKFKKFTIADLIAKSKTVSEAHEPDLCSIISESTMLIEESSNVDTAELAELPRRTSSKQCKASLQEYKELFLLAPKIIDRQPLFISRELRDKVDEVVRRLGERKMSVSGFIENLVLHHLDSYQEDIERWKRF